ncbi:MAG: alpha/beta fold hydrolase [Opitutaceae bacterium]
MAIYFARSLPQENQSSINLDDGIFMPGTNGRAILLIHGLTGTPNELRFIAWFFHSHGYTVSCPRLANHGRSMRVLQATRWEDFYASVKAAYDRLKPGHELVFAGGLSMGALLALLLAEDHPGGVAGVSCLSPTLFYDGWNVPWYHFLLRLAPWTGLQDNFFFKEEPPYGLKSERLRERVHQFYANSSFEDLHDVDRFGYPYFPVRQLTELRHLVRELRGRLGDVRCPCQVIQARHDDVSSVRNAVYIHNHVASLQKEIVYLENSYHVITADQERGRVANAMLDFIARCQPVP